MTSDGLIGPDTPIRFLHLYPPVAVSPGDTLRHVAAAMSQAASSLAVVTDNDGVRGVVSERDVVRAVGDGMSLDSPVDTVATHNPVQVAPDTALRDAAEVMLEHGVRHLLVTDGSKAVGQVSTREALRILIRTM